MFVVETVYTFSSNTMTPQNNDSICEQASLSYVYKICKVFPGTACSLLTFTSHLPLLVNLICTIYYLCVSKHCPTKFSGHVVINLIFLGKQSGYTEECSFISTKSKRKKQDTPGSL